MEATSTSHPKGLYFLYSTEMWERFNFYGMRAILSLFLVSALSFKQDEAAILYGGFLGLSYLTPMLGGYISDRYIGNRNSIVWGGFGMAIGQLLLFSSASTSATDIPLATNLMWGGLVFLIFGNGFFKPNISSMVGQLYKKGDNRLDAAFTIFYMGINTGAMLGMLICPWLGDVKVDGVRVIEAFKWGFLAAGVAITTAQFVLGTTALNASNRFIYNIINGVLSFDADGTNILVPVQIATLSSKPTLTASDIVVLV